MKYALSIFAVLAGGLLLFYAGIFDGQEPQPISDPLRQNDSPASTRLGEAGEASPQAEQQNVPQNQWETKTDDQSPVTVTVTPLELGKDAQAWKFDIVFDTHSGSLDDDLLIAAVLIDDNGAAYQPTAWEGSGPGGHHREGVLVFDVISPTPSQVTLKIKSVGGVIERTFVWSVE